MSALQDDLLRFLHQQQDEDIETPQPFIRAVDRTLYRSFTALFVRAENESFLCGGFALFGCDIGRASAVMSRMKHTTKQPRGIFTMSMPVLEIERLEFQQCVPLS